MQMIHRRNDSTGSVGVIANSSGDECRARGDVKQREGGGGGKDGAGKGGSHDTLKEAKANHYQTDGVDVVMEQKEISNVAERNGDNGDDVTNTRKDPKSARDSKDETDRDDGDGNNENDEEERVREEERRARLLSLLPPQLRSPNKWEFTPTREALEKASLTDRERAEAHADLFGIAPTGTDPGARDVRLREAAAVMDDALDCIPLEERGALSRAREAFPFLFVSVGAQSSSHVRVFLEAEEYDVGRAARRMVRYWSERERQFGEAAFAPDAFSGPADEDVVRMIHRRMAKSSAASVGYGAPSSASGAGGPTTTTSGGQDELSQIHVLATIQNFQSRRLREIDVQLSRLPHKAKQAWEDARDTRPDLADTDAHKVIFLHCCDYDAKAAARRMANYWDMKYFLFGKERAFGPVTAADLLEGGAEEGGCRRELEEGILHLVPGIDQSGRGVMVFRGDKMMRLEGLSEDRIGVLRAAWYMLHAAQYDERIWLNGLVIINITDAATVNGFDYHFFLRMKTIMCDCVPLKVKALHDCVLVNDGGGSGGRFTKRWLSTVFSVIKLFMGRSGRQRYWPHVVGSGKPELDQEVLNFEACGIAKQQLPAVLGGTLDEAGYVSEFLEERRRIEEANARAVAEAAAASAAAEAMPQLERLESEPGV